MCNVIKNLKSKTSEFTNTQSKYCNLFIPYFWLIWYAFTVSWSQLFIFLKLEPNSAVWMRPGRSKEAGPVWVWFNPWGYRIWFQHIMFIVIGHEIQNPICCQWKNFEGVLLLYKVSMLPLFVCFINNTAKR